MKIALSGKGGVGKTTTSAMLTAALGLKGHDVVAIDADPDANLAAAFGLLPDQYPVFLAEMTDLIKERTGAKDAYGGYFKLNPKVDDIPHEYSRKIGSVRLLALGGVRRGGEGCICPASSLIKALLTHLVLGSGDALIPANPPREAILRRRKRANPRPSGEYVHAIPRAGSTSSAPRGMLAGTS